jgi:hypothetical protein
MGAIPSIRRKELQGRRTFCERHALECILMADIHSKRTTPAFQIL